MDEKLCENAEFLSAIDKIDTLIMFAANHSPLTKKADVVFPIPSFAEIDGVWVNSQKRVQALSPRYRYSRKFSSNGNENEQIRQIRRG